MGSTQNHLHPQPQTFPLHLYAANLPSIQPWGLLHQFKTSQAKRSLQIRGGKKRPLLPEEYGQSILSLQLFILMQMCGSPAGSKFGGGVEGGRSWVRDEGGGARNWGASLWGPDANPKCSQGRKQNSMGAALATLAPSIKAPSATQKPWGEEGSHPFPTHPNLTRKHNQCQYWPEKFRHHQLISKLARSSAEPGREVTLTSTGSSPLVEAGVHSGMWLGLGNFTVD